MASSLGTRKTSNPSINEVQKALWPARSKWFNIGLFFEIEHGTLEAIQGHAADADKCFRDMLVKVKNSSRNLTWETICKCLRDPTVGHASLADELEAKYLKQDVQTVKQDEHKPSSHGDAAARKSEPSAGGLVQVATDRFQLLHVSEDSDLATLLKKKGFAIQPGGPRVFYEFTRSKEAITEDKEVVLMKKKTGVFYTGKKACEMIGAPGEAVETPKLDKYKVFVQSRGIGHRFVTSGTSVLYEAKVVDSMHPSSLTSSLQSSAIDASHYKMIKVKKGGELIDCIEREGLTFKPGCAFFEFVNKTEDIHERKKVILMDKDTGDMVSGPLALTLIGAPGLNIERPQLPKWRVFVQSTYAGSRFIKADSNILYQDLSSSNDDGLTRVGIDRFRVLEVEEDVDLRSFVEEQHKLEYNARKFFFEFTSREEEIGDDKEIILMDKETKELYTGSKTLEMIGAPRHRVKQPNLVKYRVFVQNAGGGARCIRAGTYVLYEVKAMAI